MLDAGEAARRRELQRRAYAPGGSLTDAEIAELRALDDRHLAAPATVAPPVPPESVAPPVPPAPPASPEPVEPPEPPASPEPVRGAQHAASVPEVTASRALRADGTDGAERTVGAAGPRRRWLVPVLAVVMVLAGFAFGRFVLGSAGDTVAMNAAQQKVWAQLEASDKYTPGSVSLLGGKYGANVWTAHRKETDVECMILTRAEKRSEACGMLEPEQGDSQLHATLDYTEDGVDYAVYASVARDILGNPISVLQRYANEEWDWRSMYSDAELAMVHTLESAGFDGAFVNIIGYDGEVPVWVSQDERYCVMVVRKDVVLQQCGQSGAPGTQTLTLDGGDAVYTVRSTENRGPVLTITRASDVTTEG